ncbi:MAG: hypothetical protein ABJE47_16215 [bacterium]
MSLSGRVWSAVALAVVSIGCSGEITAPVPLVGSYRLSLYNGAALPVTLRRLTSIPVNGGPATSCDIRLVGATLTIDGAGSATAADTVRTTCDDGRPDVVTANSNQGSVTAVGDTAAIAYPANGNALAYRSFVRRNGSGVLIFRTEIDQPVIGSTSTPPATTLSFDGTQRVYELRP